MQVFDAGYDSYLIGLGIAIAIGFIIGLEREWAENKPIGVRSASLIAALGGMSALILPETGGWPVAAGLIALSLILMSHARRDKRAGTTTVVAALVVYLLGAAAVIGYWLQTIVIGGAVMLLLHWKKPLHRWVERLGDRDFEIIVRFVLIALVVLPVLPNRTIGPYDVFNPFTAWSLVVLIVGMNVVGYIAFRLAGARAGGWAAGLLGGMVSSTATTFSYAGMSRRNTGIAPLAAMIILVASAVVYLRVLIELAVVAPELVAPMAGPSLIFSTVLVALGAVAYRQYKKNDQPDLPSRENPARIRQALAFGALYVIILFAVAATRELIGEQAIYGVAFVSGLTDVDALTLSIAQLHSNGKTGSAEAWRVIFLATLSNLLFKVVAASFLGSARLRRYILGAGSIALAIGATLLALWP